mgnify:CR=1 FL=1
MQRKKTVYKGLQFIDVWYTDTSLTSPDYFQISEFPTRLTAGKNLFKLIGNPTTLKVGGYLNLEILDYNGDPIYYEIVDYIDEDTSRVQILNGRVLYKLILLQQMIQKLFLKHCQK